MVLSGRPSSRLSQIARLAMSLAGGPATALSLAALVAACGGDRKADAPATETTSVPSEKTPAGAEPKQAEPVAAGPTTAKRGLVLALSRFAGTTPQPARAELLTPQNGLWKVESFDDPDSNVFHKAFALSMPGKSATLVTLGGMKAAVKGWR